VNISTAPRGSSGEYDTGVGTSHATAVVVKFATATTGGGTGASIRTAGFRGLKSSDSSICGTITDSVRNSLGFGVNPSDLIKVCITRNKPPVIPQAIKALRKSLFVLLLSTNLLIIVSSILIGIFAVMKECYTITKRRNLQLLWYNFSSIARA